MTIEAEQDTSGVDDTIYELSNKWFAAVKPVWIDFLNKFSPSRILEIGSFEGASACFLIEEIASKRSLELHCIDTWEGGIEHQTGGGWQADMTSVEMRFNRNIEKAKKLAQHSLELHIRKQLSDMALANLLSEGKNGYFDFIYVDGSHQAPDVLLDAILSFKLLRKGGVICFDDYLWSEPLPSGVDPIRCPKIAIDAFINIFCRQVKVMPGGGGQLFCRKTVD